MRIIRDQIPLSLLIIKMIAKKKMIAKNIVHNLTLTTLTCGGGYIVGEDKVEFVIIVRLRIIYLVENFLLKAK